ncbi:retrotransposon ORF1 [Tanacetum coccineum]
MGDENPLRTLGDYSKPSHEGYKNTIELPAGNNMPTQVNKITTSCEICSGPHDTQYCMKDPEQAFVEYASSRTDEAGEDIPSNTVKNLKLSTTLVLSAHSYPTEDPQCSTHIHSSINAITIHLKQPKESQVNEPDVEQEEVMVESNVSIEIIRDDDEPRNEGPNKGEGAAMGEPVVEYFDIFPTRDELTYHRYLMSGPIPSIFLRNPIITEGCPSNLKIPCNIRHVHIEKVYIDLNSPLNIMTRMMYNWIMRRKLNPRENANGGISNFTRRIKGMHVFVGNFTYVVDFMIVEDISLIIDPRLSQVVLGRPFLEISNMTHDPPEGVVRFIKGTDEVAYKIPHKIEQYDSLSYLEKEHTKSVYLRNDKDKRRGVEYVMSKILGFYKECLELGPEYLTGIDDEGEVT